MIVWVGWHRDSLKFFSSGIYNDSEVYISQILCLFLGSYLYIHFSYFIIFIDTIYLLMSTLITSSEAWNSSSAVKSCYLFILVLAVVRHSRVLHKDTLPIDDTRIA